MTRSPCQISFFRILLTTSESLLASIKPYLIRQLRYLCMISSSLFLKYSFFSGYRGWMGRNLASEVKRVTKSSQLLGYLTQSVNFYICSKYYNLAFVSLIDIYISLLSNLMEIGQIKKDRDTIKIKFNKGEGKSENKVVSCKDLDYAKFAEKLHATFKLKQEKHYRLYYFDSEKEEITVDNQEDYDIFIDKANPMIFYLEETQEVEQSFCNSKIKISEVQLHQQLADSKNQLNQKNSQIQFLKQKLEKVENSHLSIDVSTNTKKSKLEETISKIEKEKQTFREDLNLFKKELQEKTQKSILQRLQELRQEFQRAEKRRSGNFQHEIGCQNSTDCKFSKAIIGLRYQCLVCKASFCQNCANSQFKQKQLTHEPTHPMVRYKNDQWDNKAIQLQDPKSSSVSQEERQKDIQSKISTLVSNLKISDVKAQNLVKILPNLPKDELLKVVQQLKAALGS